MILWPRSKVTTSATQLGAHEWLMYLRAAVQRWLAAQQPGGGRCPHSRGPSPPARSQPARPRTQTAAWPQDLSAPAGQGIPKRTGKC